MASEEDIQAERDRIGLLTAELAQQGNRSVQAVKDAEEAGELAVLRAESKRLTDAVAAARADADHQVKATKPTTPAVTPPVVPPVTPPATTAPTA